MASICPCLYREFSRSLRPIKIKQAECVSWKGKKTLCHSSVAIVVSHMPDNLSLKEKGKENTLPGEKLSLFPHTPLQVLAMILLAWLLPLFRAVLGPLNWSHGRQTGFKPVLIFLRGFPQPLSCHVDHSWAGPELAPVGHFQLLLESQQCPWQTNCVCVREHESWAILPQKYV